MKDLLAKFSGKFSNDSRWASLLSSGGHSSVQAQIHARLREAILDGVLEPGQRLLQDELAAELSVSRMPIREALLRLEADGLVRFHPYKGFTVATFTLEDLKEIYFLRGLLEGATAELAALNIKEVELEKLSQLCRKMNGFLEKMELDEMPPLNADFHQTVYQAASSPRLYKMIVRLWNSFPKSNMSVVEARAQIMVQEHTAIFEALRERDGAKARKCTEHHIANAFCALETYWQSRIKS